MRLVSKRNNTTVTERPPVKETPQAPVEEKYHIYVRAGVAEDLILMNSWFQNPIVNRYSQMPRTWKNTMEWWKSLGGDVIVSMIVMNDKISPMSFYCGRTVGYIQWSELKQDLPHLFIVIGDCSVQAMGIGMKAVEFAGEQILQLKKSGKFHSIIHPEAKIALTMAGKLQKIGLIQSIGTLDSGWVRALGEFR